MVLEVLRKVLAAVKTLLETGVGDVAGNDDGTAEAEPGRNRIFGKFLEDFGHWLVEVDLDAAAFARPAELLRDETARIIVEFLDPDTVLVDLCLDVAVCGAAYAETDRAARSMARQTYDTDVMSHVFAAELSAEADLAGLFPYLFLKFDVAECAAGLIAGSRKAVIIMG
jgi:hypothetical protein